VITIRLQTPDDLEVAEEVGHSALGPSQTIGDTYRIAQRAQPDGSFLAVEDGEAVGTATIVDYGPFCYIGAMCVRAERQRQGIGRALLERVLAWKEEKGIPIARLDASDAGAPLYRRLGFREIGGALWFRRGATRKTGPLPDLDAPAAEIVTRPLSEAELGSILELDRPVFGGDREILFRSFLRLFPGRTFVALTGEELAGFVFCQGARIGPWVARDASVAEPLLRRALELPFRGAPSLCTPVENRDGRRLLESHGFRATQTSAHMALGSTAPAGRRSMVYSQSSFAFG